MKLYSAERDYTFLAKEMAGLDHSGLAIVFFHVDQEAKHPLEGFRGGVKCDYHELLRYAVMAAKIQHPEARVFIVTDEATNFMVGLPVHILRFPMVREWIGYERVVAQYWFHQHWGGKTIHLDTDIFLRERFDPIFAEPSDITLSWRPHTGGQHINGGMMVVRHSGAATRFLGTMIAAYDAIADVIEHDFNLRCCFGEQMVLALMMSNRGPGRHKTPWGIIDVVEVGIINRDYRPDDKGMPLPFAWHLKGYRKKWLPELLKQMGAA